MPDQCGNCDYMREVGSYMECRANVPEPKAPGNRGWSYVKATDWCKDWAAIGASDPANWSIQGLIVNTTTKTKVAETDVGYYLYVVGVDVTNTSVNKVVMVKFFDGNTEDITGICSVGPNQSASKTVVPPIRANTGQVWAQLESSDGSDIYIYVHIKRGRSLEVQQTKLEYPLDHPAPGDLGSVPT